MPDPRVPDMPLPTRDPGIPQKQPSVSPPEYHPDPNRRTSPEVDPPGRPEVHPMREPPNIQPPPSEVPFQGRAVC